MKCPKCGYHSFDHLESCKKCGQGLTEHKEKFNLRGFFAPGQAVATEPDPIIDNSAEEEDEESTADGSFDFGFDFLDGADTAAESETGVPLAEDDQDVSIDRPFGADSETIPADAPASVSETDSDGKSGKGSEFAF